MSVGGKVDHANRPDAYVMPGLKEVFALYGQRPGEPNRHAEGPACPGRLNARELVLQHGDQLVIGDARHRENPRSQLPDERFLSGRDILTGAVFGLVEGESADAVPGLAV